VAFSILLQRFPSYNFVPFVVTSIERNAASWELFAVSSVSSVEQFVWAAWPAHRIAAQLKREIK
jgi:hypothetical protein